MVTPVNGGRNTKGNKGLDLRCIEGHGSRGFLPLNGGYPYERVKRKGQKRIYQVQQEVTNMIG